MATTADEDVPPLEDMSHVLHTLQLNTPPPQDTPTHTATRGSSQDTPTHPAGGVKESSHAGCRLVKSAQSEDDLIKPPKSDGASSKIEKPKPPLKSSTSNASGSAGGFGGLKKGFLFGGPPSSSSTLHSSSLTESPAPDEMPFLQTTTSPSEPLRMPEVEAAMESTQTFLEKKDWVTASLLDKVASNPTLARNLANPQFAQALSEFQTNPQAAMAKYQENKEVHQVFKEFCQLLGDHFNDMGEHGTVTTDPPPSPSGEQHLVPIDPEQSKVDDILSDPETRQLLMDPEVQNVIGLLKNDPHKAQRFINQANTDLKLKINKLINMGLLQIQPI